MVGFIISLLINLIVSFLPAGALAQTDAQIVSVEEINKVARNNPFLDPAFQNYVEINYGYLKPGLKNSFRDALSSGRASMFAHTDTQGEANPPEADSHYPVEMPVGVSGSITKEMPPSIPKEVISETTYSRLIFGLDTFKTSVNPLLYKVKFVGETSPLAGFVPPLDYSGNNGISYKNYVFVHIEIEGQDYSKLVENLKANAGFRFVGHKTIDTLKGDNLMLVLGWVSYNNLGEVYRNSEVMRVSIEKNPDAFPVKVRVDFILKIPYMSNQEEFAVSFLNYARKQMEFAPEKISKPSERFFSISASRFSALNIVGNLPVNKVVELLKSPFVTNLKVQNSSL